MTLGDSASAGSRSPKYVLTVYSNGAVNWELTLQGAGSCLVHEFQRHHHHDRKRQRGLDDVP